jgi:mono/diheme cytochrome c family protein
MTSFRTASLIASGVVLTVAAACTQQTPPPPPPAAPAQPVAQQSPVERGKYVVEAGGCNDCHTPWRMGAGGQPEPDMSRYLSGHQEADKLPPPPRIDPKSPWIWGGAAMNTAFYGPWGVSYAMNLTPDQNTGLGIWTEDMFVRAIRTGKHMGEASSRDILPPMPWPAFKNFNDVDLKAIYAYLRTIKPVTNHVPDPVPPSAPPAGKGN